ncbi:checkpoint protein Hus1/Mec3 [Gongronella butleri]|nr:checkpoint protein Hus1/Mec3 [Gongronella butleri]
MRFRAFLVNPTGLLQIAQALEKLGPTCILCMNRDSVYFIRSHDQEAGVNAWIKTDPNTLFSNYRIDSSADNEISMSLLVDSLLRVTKMAQQAASVKISLRAGNGGTGPVLDWRIEMENRVGTSNDSSHELEVHIIPRERMQDLREPPVLATPQAYVLLPNLASVKSVADRMKSLSKFLTLAVNMNGQLKLSVETELAEVEALFSRLENPRLEGHQTDHENRSNFVSGRVATDDFVHFLHCHHLDPQNVICGK